MVCDNLDNMTNYYGIKVDILWAVKILFRG